jgi:hypothetical protein
MLSAQLAEFEELSEIFGKEAEERSDFKESYNRMLQVIENECFAPELLAYEHDLVEKIRSMVQRQVEFTK